MEDTCGFYRFYDGEWYYAPTAVYAPTYTLLKAEKDNYVYPIDGWEWYDTCPFVVKE